MTVPALEVKAFPENYSDDVVEIIRTMAFSDGIKILGSSSLRSQRYAGDLDMYEVVHKTGERQKVLRELRVKFQKNVRKLMTMPNVWIGDIKAGCIDKWRIIPRSAMVKDGAVVGWNYTASKSKLDQLKSMGIISENEYAKASATLKPHPTLADFFAARDANKFHILRWTSKNVLANRLVLRDKSTVTLEEAFQQPSITKMDVIGLVQGNRFTDFSVIYEFRDGSTVLNPDPIDIEISLKADIQYYSSKGKYFKAIKRIFALAKYKGDVTTVEKLTPVLNSDLGLLYHVVGDIGTLINLLDKPGVPLGIVKFEIDQFIGRLSNIYTLKGFLRDEPKLVTEIKRILGLSRKAMIPALEKLEEALNKYLQESAKKVWDKMGLGRMHGGLTQSGMPTPDELATLQRLDPNYKSAVAKARAKASLAPIEAPKALPTDDFEIVKRLVPRWKSILKSVRSNSDVAGLSDWEIIKQYVPTWKEMVAEVRAYRRPLP